MATLIFPTPDELHEIEQEIAPRMLEGRVGLELLPIENDDNHIVQWEQKDNFGGMQQIRGLNGDPKAVGKSLGKKFMFAPGVYGEFEPFDEMEITKRRKWGSRDQHVNMDDLTRDAQDKLLVRRYNRMEWIIWQVLLNGTFLVPTPAENDVPGGAIYRASFAIQNFASGIGWDNHANSTPLADLRAMALLSRGKGTNFGSVAKFYINQTTANHMLANTNPNDLGAYRKDNAIQMDSVGGVNTLLRLAGVPEVIVYDEGDFDEANQFGLYIPDLRAALIGRRNSGVPLGKYKCTRNANNDGFAPGPYTDVIDRGAPGPGRQIPRTVEVHDGHNGGPCLEFPGTVVSCDLTG
ncbi:hypothetical protein EON80_08655 [bacterium]|nr:MAG: hypothetical protein EON80_08655 [bacterium]